MLKNVCVNLPNQWVNFIFLCKFRKEAHCFLGKFTQLGKIQPYCRSRQTSSLNRNGAHKCTKDSATNGHENLNGVNTIGKILVLISKLLSESQYFQTCYLQYTTSGLLIIWGKDHDQLSLSLFLMGLRNRRSGPLKESQERSTMIDHSQSFSISGKIYNDQSFSMLHIHIMSYRVAVIVL